MRNPCAERSWRNPGSVQAVAEQIALSALDGAACHFGVSRETLTLALASSSSRARFARQHHVDSRELENAVRRGLERSVADAQHAGAISGWRATLLRLGAEHVPVEQMADLVGVLQSLASKPLAIPAQLERRRPPERKAARLGRVHQLESREALEDAPSRPPGTACARG